MKLFMAITVMAVLATACNAAEPDSVNGTVVTPVATPESDSTTSTLAPDMESIQGVGFAHVPDADPPNPSVYEGVEIRWEASDRECPEGLTCQPCWHPSPSTVTDSDGTEVRLGSEGCGPEIYTTNGDESLNDLLTSFGNKFCIEDDDWRDRPGEPLPEGTLIWFC